MDSKITFSKILTVITFISVLTGIAGAASFFYFKNKSHQEFLQSLQQNNGSPTPVGDLHIEIVPDKVTALAGEETPFEVDLKDGNGVSVAAPKDLVVTIRPTPGSETFRYKGDTSLAVVVKKGFTSTTAKYTETLAGKYQLIFYADGFSQGTTDLEVKPGDVTSVAIAVPDQATPDEMSAGITLSGNVYDKYKNRIVDGLNWTVNKNGGGEQQLGSKDTFTYSDTAASSCDTYVFKLSAGDITATKTVIVKESADFCG